MSEEQDQIFFRNFAMVVVGIAGMMVLFYVAASLSGATGDYGDKDREKRVAKITKPVGTVVADGEEIVEATAETVATETIEVAATDTAEASGDIGETTYKGICASCHGMPAMAAMFPQTGDADAWSPRIAKGIETLYKHAIEGYVGEMGMMPAKGGNPALSDNEVKAAVDYIVSAVQ